MKYIFNETITINQNKNSSDRKKFLYYSGSWKKEIVHTNSFEKNLIMALFNKGMRKF